MDDLRHGTGDDERDETIEPEHEEDGAAAVLDRLSAYGHQTGFVPEEDDPDDDLEETLAALVEPVEDEHEETVEEGDSADESEPVEFEAAVESDAAVENDAAVESDAAVEEAVEYEAHVEDDAVEYEAVVEVELVEEDHAVEDHSVEDHAVEAALEVDSEPDEPAPGTIASGPSEPERRRRLALRQRSEAPTERRKTKPSTHKKASWRDRRSKKLEANADPDQSRAAILASGPSEPERRRRRPLRQRSETLTERRKTKPSADKKASWRDRRSKKLEANSDLDESNAGIFASVPSEPERRRRLALRQRSDAPAKQPKTKVSKDKKASSNDKRAKKLVGLKIGASQIAAAQIVNNGAPELVELFREPLEAGLVVSGEIRDPDALGEALKRFFDLHKLPKRGIRLGLANNRIGVRVFEIEGVSDSQQLDNAIRFRAEEVLPIPLDQAVLDYVVLEDEAREDGTPVKRILLVVAYREVVDRYLQACRGAGLQVVGIDLEAFALLRSLEAPADRDPSSGALVAVAIGHDRTTIAVSTGRLCEFTRVLDWGGWSLNIAIARELDKAPSEVEGIKRQLSLGHDTDVEGLTYEQVAKVRGAVQRALDAFSRELVASLHFYQAQPGALGIGEVVLTGGTAHMDGLPEAVGALVGVPVRLGDPLRRLRVGPHVAQDIQPGSVAIAIGLGIED